MATERNWRTVNRIHSASERVMDATAQLADRAAATINRPGWIPDPEAEMVRLRAELDQASAAFDDALSAARRGYAGGS